METDPPDTSFTSEAVFTGGSRIETLLLPKQIWVKSKCIITNLYTLLFQLYDFILSCNLVFRVRVVFYGIKYNWNGPVLIFYVPLISRGRPPSKT
jgi:hypothetical protein